jgi:hypothetical protein
MTDTILQTRLRALEQSLTALERPYDAASLFRWNQTAVQVAIWQRFESEIIHRVRMLRNEIALLLNNLAGKAKEHHPNHHEAEAWDRYARLNEQSQAVFTEWLDCLWGLTFREKQAALDPNQICQIMDELAWAWAKLVFVSPTLIVPAGGAPAADTLGTVLRFPCTEWSVWSLPSVAHEFGHMVIADRNYPRLRQVVLAELPSVLELDHQFRSEAGERHSAGKELKKAKAMAETRARRKLDTFLADAFGTCVLGPAYACAAIYLRLHPAADTDGPIDHERAHVVLGFLKAMSVEAQGAYNEVLYKLHENWRKMVSSAGGAKDAGAALPKGMTPLPILDRLIAAMWRGFSESFPTSPLYPHNRTSEGWPVAKMWADQWTQALRASSTLTLPDLTINSMLRDALNAGWLCRLEEPGRARDIEPAVSKLCLEIIKKRREGRESSMPIR